VNTGLPPGNNEVMPSLDLAIAGWSLAIPGGGERLYHIRPVLLVLPRPLAYYGFVRLACM